MSHTYILYIIQELKYLILCTNYQMIRILTRIWPLLTIGGKLDRGLVCTGAQYDDLGTEVPDLTCCLHVQSETLPSTGTLYVDYNNSGNYNVQE